MKGPYIFTALLLAASQAANAGSYRDTAKRPSDTVKVEDCGKNICAMISFGGHKFVVKDSDIAKALKDSDIFSKLRNLFEDAEPADSDANKEPEIVPQVAPPPVTAAAPAAPAPQVAAAPANAGVGPSARIDPPPAAPVAAPVAPPVVQSGTGEKKVATTNQAAAYDPTSPVGEWIVEDGTGRVQVQPCGSALCGLISSAKNPRDTDRHNPDASKRSRPLLGLPILLDMKPTKPNRWEGRIYSPEDGKTYTSNLSLKNPDVLRVEGCAFGGLFCGGQNWTRAKDAPQG